MGRRQAVRDAGRPEVQDTASFEQSAPSRARILIYGEADEFHGRGSCHNTGRSEGGRAPREPRPDGAGPAGGRAHVRRPLRARPGFRARDGPAGRDHRPPSPPRAERPHQAGLRRGDGRHRSPFHPHEVRALAGAVAVAPRRPGAAGDRGRPPAAARRAVAHRGPPDAGPPQPGLPAPLLPPRSLRGRRLSATSSSARGDGRSFRPRPGTSSSRSRSSWPGPASMASCSPAATRGSSASSTSCWWPQGASCSTASLRPAFASPAGYYAADRLAELHHRRRTTPAALPRWHYDEVSASYRRGEAAMVSDWPGSDYLYAATEHSAVAERTGLARLPGGFGGRRAAYAGCHSFAIPASGAEPRGRLRSSCGSSRASSRSVDEARRGALPVRRSAFEAMRAEATPGRSARPSAWTCWRRPARTSSFPPASPPTPTARTPSGTACRRP